MPVFSLNKLVKDIKSLKIQGAEAVSYEAVKAIKAISQSTKAKTGKALFLEIQSAKKKLFEARPTEPYLRNSLNSVFYHLEETNDLKKLKNSVFSSVQKTLKEMELARKRIIEIGSKKIKSGMLIFTHCHSSTVIAILLEAKKQGKKFTVHNTETRPRWQGRMTSKDIAKAGIPVVHYIDSAARYALKNADMMLIGADAITSEGNVINKIGSEMFAEIADRHSIPVYSCTNSWKFDPETIFGFTEEIEQRIPSEVWKNPPKGVKIDNHAFEIVDADSVTGIISELGIFSSKIFVEEVIENYPWMAKRKI